MSDQNISFATGLGTNVSILTPVAVNPITVTPLAVSSIGAVGPVTVAGIPDTFHIFLEKLPKLTIGLDPVELKLDPIELKLDPIELRLTELPSIRGHLPADFTVGLSVLGLELLCVRLCGEAQIVTEPFRPNPCEVCGAVGQLQSVPVAHG